MDYSATNRSRWAPGNDGRRGGRWGQGGGRDDRQRSYYANEAGVSYRTLSTTSTVFCPVSYLLITFKITLESGSDAISTGVDIAHPSPHRARPQAHSML